MSIIFDVTSSDNAYGFLLDTLGLQPGELVMEYLVECNRDIDLFLERNIHRLNNLDVQDVRFVAFHVMILERRVVLFCLLFCHTEPPSIWCLYVLTLKMQKVK